MHTIEDNRCNSRAQTIHWGHLPGVGVVKLTTTRKIKLNNHPIASQETHGHYNQESSKDKNTVVNIKLFFNKRICCLALLYADVYDFYYQTRTTCILKQKK